MSSEDRGSQQRRPRVALIGTLDTKQAEYDFVSDWLSSHGGCSVTLLNVSTRPSFRGDGGLEAEAPVGPSETGTQPEVLHPAAIFRASSDERSRLSDGEAEERMAKLERHELRAALLDGCIALLASRVAAETSESTNEQEAHRSIDAIAAFGGSQNTSFACAVMRNEAFQLGFPKFCLTTMASGDISQYIGESDICLMPSVGDISGTLNAITRTVLTSAAAAIAGMATAYRQSLTAKRPVDRSEKPLVAVSMFGVTTPCVNAASEALKSKGYEPVAFHATGTGGRTMERLIREKYFAGVLDLTTTELCDDLFGGVLSAGPDRLVSAIRCGVPSVASVGALDMINFGALSTLPPSLGIDGKKGGGPLHVSADGRKVWEHNESVTLLRTSVEESGKLGESLVERLSRGSTGAKQEGRDAGSVTIVLPLRGVSMLDKEGEAFCDVDARKALFEAVERHSTEGDLTVQVEKLDHHINDPEFARAVADRLVAAIEKA